MISNNFLKRNTFVMHVMVATIFLIGSTSAVAQSQEERVEERWFTFLDGSRITNETEIPTMDATDTMDTIDTMDPTDTLISDYYLCSDGTFVHKNATISGGLPPQTLALKIGDVLTPQGTWEVVILVDGFGTIFANLQLASPGAVRLYPLAFVENNDFIVDGLPFTRDPNNETECGNDGDPFVAQSPLQ